MSEIDHTLPDGGVVRVYDFGGIDVRCDDGVFRSVATTPDACARLATLAGVDHAGDLLALIRELRGVGTAATPHRYMGSCPDVKRGDGARRRDPACLACDVLRRADALLCATAVAS